MARILVTDGEQRSSLAAARSLSHAGHEVHVCSARARPLAGASRHVSVTHRVSNPFEHPEAFRDEVQRIVERERIDVLLPMTDTSVPVLLALRERMPGLVVPFPPAETYAAITDKRNLMEVAGRIGVPVPRQVVAERPSMAAVVQATFDAETPVVLKPAHSAVVTAAGVRRFGVRMLDRAADVGAGLETYPDEAFPILVQQRISGPGLGAFLLTEGGRTLAEFGHRRLREKPPTGGVSVYRESVRLRDDVRAYAERILEAFDWTGVAMVEFKEDASTGVPYLMEVNGRFWGSLQLAIDAGVDFPRMLVSMGLGTSPEPVGAPREGLRSRWLWGDVDHLLWMLLRGRRARAHDPSLPGSLEAIGRFLVPWRPGDRFEVLRLSDPGPFVRESLQWVEHVVRR